MFERLAPREGADVSMEGQTMGNGKRKSRFVSMSVGIGMMGIGIVLLLGVPVRAQVYEFTGTYCAACKAVQPVIDELVDLGYPIEQIDVQTRTDFARQHNVKQIPCFFAVRDGQVVARVDRAVDRSELIKLCELTRPVESPVVRGQTGRPLRGRLLDRLRGRQDANCRCQQDNCQCQFQEEIVEVAPPVENGVVVPPAISAEPLVSGIVSETVIADRQACAKCATVRLRIEDGSGHSFGTGTIIDVHNNEALILTCGHIFRASEGKGRVMCELFCPNAPPPIEGKLICYDMRRDVGLISMKPGIPVKPVSVGGTGQRPRQGDRVFSVGCNRGDDPTFIKNEILAVNRYHGPANIVVGGRPVDGRSGGGLFNSDGVLIGVCNAADQEADEGLYAALGPIHAELDNAGLGFVYRPKQPTLAANPNAPFGDRISASPPSNLSTSRAADQEAAPLNREPALEPIAAPPVAVPVKSAPNSNQLPNPAPNRSVQTSGPSELICVVRDAKDKEGRVFVIDQPSSALVRQLSKEAGARGAHSETQSRQSSSSQFRTPGDVVGTNGWSSQRRP